MFVSGLFLYPIKSCRGISVKELVVGPRGPEGDRRWMLVGGDGKFLTQRTHPALARVATRLEGKDLVVEAEGHGALRVTETPGAGSREREVTVWNDRVLAVTHGNEADRWFSAYLGLPCHLVRLADGHHRRRRRKNIQPDEFEVNFPDSAPFLLTSEESLADLNGRLPKPVPMDRFRPNVVISGAPAFAEDRWQSLQIGEVSFPALYRCDRCVIITTDQLTGAREPEPLRTLAAYRREDGKVHFGQRLIHRGTGTIRVGDSVRGGGN